MAEADRYFVFRFSNNRIDKSYASITKSILRSIRSKATEWRSGKPVRPSKGCLHILLYPNWNWTGAEYAPVELLLRYSNLYLEAFKVSNVWYQFAGSPIQIPPSEQYEIRQLGFTGGYPDLDARFDILKVGIYAFTKSYKALSNYHNRVDDDNVKSALVVLILMFAEALRFTKLRKWIIGVMRSGLDDSLPDLGNFSVHFRNWDTYCRMIRGGRDKFKPRNGINTYEELLSFIRVLIYKSN